MDTRILIFVFVVLLVGCKLRKSNVVLPHRYDASVYIPHIPIVYQSTCGSCWANATVTALQFRAYRHSLTDGLFDADDVLKNTLGNFGCAGGSISRAYKFCATTGLFCKGRRYPLNRYRNITGVGIEGLKTEVLSNGPVTAQVKEYPSMKRLKRGEVWARRSDETVVGSHAVVIYGWDDTRGGWLVQNSWGDSWCEGGRGVFSYGAGNIESLFVFAGDFLLTWQREFGYSLFDQKILLPLPYHWFDL